MMLCIRHVRSTIVFLSIYQVISERWDNSNNITNERRRQLTTTTAAVKQTAGRLDTVEQENMDWCRLTQRNDDGRDKFSELYNTNHHKHTTTTEDTHDISSPLTHPPTRVLRTYIPLLLHTTLIMPHRSRVAVAGGLLSLFAVSRPPVVHGGQIDFVEENRQGLWVSCHPTRRVQQHAVFFLGCRLKYTNKYK